MTLAAAKAASVPRNTAPEAPGAKAARLFEQLGSFDSVIIAFSGGVDSAYLAWAATQVLGSSAICITADSPSYPDHHRRLALRLAREFGLHHELVSTAELQRPEYRANPVNRCYYCKHELYTTLSGLALERGIATIADGSNADDRGDYRPGRQAARQFGVRSPLDDANLTKDDIRRLSREAGLPTWDEPASACLSSRIPYQSPVTDGKLRMIERAEEAVRALGFRICRVRHHDADAGGALARVEIGRDELPRALAGESSDRLIAAIKGAGYDEVAIDPRGYRMGSLNEGLRLRPV